MGILTYILRACRNFSYACSQKRETWFLILSWDQAPQPWLPEDSGGRSWGLNETRHITRSQNGAPLGSDLGAADQPTLFCRRPCRSPRVTEPGNATTAARTMQFIVLEQGFWGPPINTGTMSDLQTLARCLLANFRTIRLPADALPARPNLQPSDWWAMAKARRAEKRMLYDLRDRLRRALIQHRHRFIDCREPDPEGGWRLHIFVLDENALALLDGIADRRCAPGDPVDFDPEEFVIERLREWIERGIIQPDE